MNKVFLIGNLTRDPEASETGSGLQYCRFAIAVNRPFANADGNREVDFFNIIAWRGQAEICNRYLKKGNKVAIEGSIQIRSYDDKDGNRRQAIDIVADRVEFLTSRNQGEGSDYDAPAPTAQRANRPASKPTLEQVDDDDQLPF
ncbi:MAG: single-stranded DNA-binding protein [Clostridia bacterium]|nr:single-stranded DNA-binding protein [Clostridia bacterium]